MAVNQGSGGKSTSKAKLKAANQEERLQKGKEQFKNLHVKPPQITDKLTKELLTRLQTRTVYRGRP